MILIAEHNTYIDVILSLQDVNNICCDSEYIMNITNTQTKENHCLNILSSYKDKRKVVFKFIFVDFDYLTETVVPRWIYYYGPYKAFQLFNEMLETGFTSYYGINYIYDDIIKEGTYDYNIGPEIGLLQLGIPQLNKNEYNTQNNNIIYNG